MTRSPANPPGSCSTTWDVVPEPAWGTAAVARFWVALEQPGPWGRYALTQSRLDPRLGAELERRCHDLWGRALLIRGVRDSREHAPSRPRRVFVSTGMPRGEPRLLTGQVADPAELLDLPWSALAAGDLDALTAASPGLTRTEDPVLLLCTNGKRDLCCAARGLPLARAIADARPDVVWECTHTGGHRFAPTGVILPHGLTLGRLDAPHVLAALDAAATDRIDRTVNDARHLRGLSHLDPPLQAADAYVRHHGGVEDLTALSVTPAASPSDVDGSSLVDVTVRDGRRWRLRVASRESGVERPHSCGAGPLPVTAFEVTPA